MRSRKLAAALIAVVLIGAASLQEIPHRGGGGPGRTLIVPADSPVTFKGWNEYQNATFNGRFTLTGEFALTLMDACVEPGRPAAEDCLTLDIKPEPSIARRLPRYRMMGGEMKGGDPEWLIITNEKKLVGFVSSPMQRAALLSGKLRSVTGRTSIIVDQFEAGGDCDSPWLAVRFVALAEPPKPAKTKFAGGFGCGY